MDILLKIQKKFNNLTEKEKDIAKYILEYKAEVKNMSITKLAEETETSPATVTRFSKKIGVTNFVELKMGINTFNELENNAKVDDIFKNITNFYREVLKKSQQLVDKNTIINLVEEINKAKKIYIYGIGSSGLTAEEMRLRLLRMGFDVSSITDSHLMKINSAIISESDLVIAISISGKTKEIVESLKISQLNGAKTILITSFENTMANKYTDMEVLIYNIAFVDQQRFINSQFSAMHLLDIICTVLLQDKKINEKYGKTVSTILNNN
jgi:DNA-binding MurR/RpiR family transcriptional regulator